eukprot:7364698-Prymnesium_polylepis.1
MALGFKQRLKKRRNFLIDRSALGHSTSCSKSALLVFGGADAQHRKQADAWQLDLRREEVTAHTKLELRLDAWTAEQVAEAHRAAKLAEIAAADAAAQVEVEAAKGGGKGGKGAAKPPAGKKGEEPPPGRPPRPRRCCPDVAFCSTYDL